MVKNVYWSPYFFVHALWISRKCKFLMSPVLSNVILRRQLQIHNDHAATVSASVCFQAWPNSVAVIDTGYGSGSADRRRLNGGFWPVLPLLTDCYGSTVALGDTQQSALT